jgi:hypothetical protein
MEKSKQYVNVERVIETGKQIASRIVLLCLTKVLGQSPGNEKLIQDIMVIIPYKFSGYLSMDLPSEYWPLNNGIPMKLTLRMQLTLAVKGVEYDPIDVPPSEDVTNSVLMNYDLLRKTAIAYWGQFCKDYPEIVERIRVACPGIVDLRADSENQSLLILHPESPNCISVFSYWVDGNGNPFARKKGH